MERRSSGPSGSEPTRRVRVLRELRSDAGNEFLHRVETQRKRSTKTVAALICMMLAVPVMAMAASSVLVAAAVDDTPVPTPLMACQDLQVGVVDIWNDFDYLYVKYDITEAGWFLLETHCDVATSPDEIPQKNGNPIPGKFDCCAWHDPLVDEYTCAFDLSLWPAGTQLFVAAHAAVVHVIDVTAAFVSDDTTVWSGDQVTWMSAVECYEHPAWADVADAEWIWTTEFTDPAWEYVNAPDDGWYFKKDLPLHETAFDIVGSVTANADNCEAVYVNGDFILQDGVMDKDAADTYSYRTTETADISASLGPGPNSMIVRSLNYYDWGTYSSNPAGLAFRVDVSYSAIDIQESAWAAGYDFWGANWATYVAYTVKSWDIGGDWVLRFLYGTTNYDHDVDASVVQQSDGSFTATGGYPAGGPYTHTWEATGTVVRDGVEFHIVYLTGNVGYEAWVQGTISSVDASMSGTWYATGQPGPYNWWSLSGAATWC